MVLISLLWSLLSPTVVASTVYVAAASNFATTLRLLAESFQAGSSHRLKISTASTGTLFAQIRHGAPFDVFLAADAERPRLLVEDGYAIRDSLFTYAVGKLVLWRPLDCDGLQEDARRAPASEDTVGPRMLTDLSRSLGARLAIANPKTAPYGKAAEETLRFLGLWRGLQSGLVRGENIGQTYQFVISGAAEMGFVALSQLQNSSCRKEDRKDAQLWIVPVSLYTPLHQQAVLLTLGQGNPGAKGFWLFLQSPEAREVIRSQGYGVSNGL